MWGEGREPRALNLGPVAVVREMAAWRTGPCGPRGSCTGSEGAFPRGSTVLHAQRTRRGVGPGRSGGRSREMEGRRGERGERGTREWSSSGVEESQE